MTDIPPLLSLANSKHERSEVLARPARLCEADNDHLLLVSGLYLEPFASTFAGEISGLGTFRHDPFLFLLLGLLEVFWSVLPPMLAIRKQTILRDDLLKMLFAFYEWQITHVFAVEKQYVEEIIS